MASGEMWGPEPFGMPAARFVSTPGRALLQSWLVKPGLALAVCWAFGPVLASPGDRRYRHGAPTQEPLLQLWQLPQACPQLPQLSGDVARLVSHPSARLSPLQSP